MITRYIIATFISQTNIIKNWLYHFFILRNDNLTKQDEVVKSVKRRGRKPRNKERNNI